MNCVGLLYNLFADVQLGLGLVPQSVYQMQSEFYPTVANKYGVPLDTRHSYTKSEDFTPIASDLKIVLTETQVTGNASLRQSARKELEICSSNALLHGSMKHQQTDLSPIYMIRSRESKSSDFWSSGNSLLTEPSYPENTFVARPVMGGSFAPLLVR